MTAVEWQNEPTPLADPLRRLNALIDELSGGWANCETCSDYVDHRAPVFIPAAHEISDETGVHHVRLVRALMHGVHRRHLTGMPILPEAAA